MARFARVVVPQAAHHITQRGNARQAVFHSPGDFRTYLQLLADYSAAFRLRVLGYCLMSNHVHLVVIPERADSMALALRQTHGRYAAFLNAVRASSGHLWQGRYYSCPLDEAHLWTALRYTELNPVRAGLVDAADAYPWSSARAHCREAADPLLEVQVWRDRWTPSEWRRLLSDPAEPEEDVEAIRTHTHTGRPLGSREFVADLERRLARRLAPSKGGRPPRRRAAAAPVFAACGPP